MWEITKGNMPKKISRSWKRYYTSDWTLDEIIAHVSTKGYVPKSIPYKDYNAVVEKVYKKCVELAQQVLYIRYLNSPNRRKWKGIVSILSISPVMKDVVKKDYRKLLLEFVNELRDVDVSFLYNEYIKITGELEKWKTKLYYLLRPLVYGLLKKHFWGWRDYWDDFFNECFAQVCREVLIRNFDFRKKKPLIAYFHHIFYLTCLGETLKLQKHHLSSYELLMEEKEITGEE